MRVDAKKVLERHYLNHFAERQGWEYQFDLSESPDFVARTDARTLGVELTRLFKSEDEHGSAARRREARNARFLSKAKERYDAEGGAPISVQALLPTTPDDDAVTTLVRRLRRHRPADLMEVARFESQLTPGPKSVVYVRALPEKLRGHDWWQCTSDSVGWVGAITTEMLTAKIKEKATKLPTYRKKADRVALLIVADRTRGSGMLDFDPGSAPLTGMGFDEVHLLMYPMDCHRIA